MNTAPSATVAAEPDAVLADSAASGGGAFLQRLARVGAIVVLLAGFVLLTRPYVGIRHDSILYFGQALQVLLPGDLSRDLFFEFGSQAQFTIFPQIMAALLARSTAEVVSMSLVVIGLLAFVAASGALVRVLVAPGERLLAVFVLLALPGGYGAFNVFNYAEPFLTARTFAEPLTLVALAAFLAGSYVTAGICIAVGFLFHPLQVIPGVIVIWVLLVLRSRRWLHLAWLAIPVVLLAVMDVGPFGRLAQRFDPQWMHWIREPNRHVFLLQWPLMAWCQMLADVLLLVLASRTFDGVARRLATALLLALAGGLVFSLVFGDLLQLVMATGVQAWRVHWLAHWAAVVFAPVLVVRLWREGSSTSRARAFLLAALTVLGAPAGEYSAAYAVPLLGALCFCWPAIELRASASTRKLALAAVVLALFVAYVKYVVMVVRSPATAGLEVAVVLLHPLVLAALAIGAWHAYGRLQTVAARRFAFAAAALGSLGILVLGVATWDHRSNWNRYVERFSVTAPSPFGVELPRGAQVYWTEELLTPWLVLHRASYWNEHQEAGLLFNRGTAEEAAKRASALAVIEVQGLVCSMVNSFEGGKRCRPDRETIEETCKAAGPTLEYVVLPFAMQAPVLGTWTIPWLSDRDKPVTYYLYACPGSRPVIPHR